MFVDLATFTTIHTMISLVAILAGTLVLIDLLGFRLPHLTTPIFLLTAIATSATGFGFPFNGLLPSHIVGAIALAVLAVVVVARYFAHLSGAWRWIYAAGMVASLYLLVFVGVAQAFAKISVLRAAAPTQSEPPFAIAQLVVLAIFVALGIAAAKRFRPEAAPFAAPPRQMAG
jgi:hypothetical protein